MSLSIDDLTPSSRAHFIRRQRVGMMAWLDQLDERADRHAVAEHFVYRAFDEFGLLLYVGCTMDVQTRMSGHNYKPWRPYMHRLEVSEAFAGKEAGRAAEKLAMESEGPFFNCTQADVNRTNANLNAAKQHLGWLGIFPPQYDIEEGEIDTFAETQEWADYCAEGEAYRELVDELRAELKADDFPYLTDEDRLENYLAARRAMEAAA